MLRTSISRGAPAVRSMVAKPALCSQQRFAHAVSNPTLVDIEKRWEAMPPSEQADLWMALRDRMKANWAELTPQEKKAAYWIAFGAHGPRAGTPPGEGRQVLLYTSIGLLAAFALFAGARSLAKPAPKTMTKEYEEATTEYLKGQKSEPITGLSSEGYSGRGMVQSKPAKKE